MRLEIFGGPHDGFRREIPDSLGEIGNVNVFDKHPYVIDRSQSGTLKMFYMHPERRSNDGTATGTDAASTEGSQ